MSDHGDRLPAGAEVHNEVQGSVHGPVVQAGVHIGDNYFHPPPAAPMEVELPDLDVAEIGWWNSVDPNAELTWTPPFDQSRRPVLIAVVVWLAAVPLGWIAFSLLDDDKHNALYSTLFGLLLPMPFLLLILVIPRHARVGRAIVLGLSFYFGAGFVVGPIIAVFVTWPSILLLPTAAGYFLVPLVSRYRRRRAFDKQFTAEFRRLNYFGAPAPAHVHAAGDQQPFDPGRRMLAVRLTDHLLRAYLVHIPAIRIFHQIATPGSRLPIVDHAVLCGRRLVLIDSVIWPMGRYVFDGSGYVLRNGYPFPEGALVLSGAVHRIQKQLPGIEVRGIVLVWPERSEGPIDTGWYPAAEVAAVTAGDFVNQVGGWLSANPTTVDRNALLNVRDLVRS